MPFDSVTTAAVAAELEQNLTGGRVDRIYQSDDRTIVLDIYAGGKNRHLLVSAHPQFGRCHLAAHPPRPLPTPPPFTMLLRKNVEGARLRRVSQPPGERILEFEFDASDELGERTIRRLIVEAMGKRGNVVLVAADGRVVDALRRATREQNAVREIWPGRPYTPPPTQAGVPIGSRSVPQAAAAGTTQDSTELGCLTIARALQRLYRGMSPFLAQAVALDAGYYPDGEFGQADPAVLDVSLGKYAHRLATGHFEPALAVASGRQPADVWCWPHPAWRAHERRESMSAALEEYFGRAEEAHRISAVRTGLSRVTGDALERALRRIEAQESDLRAASRAEELRIFGELVTAHLHLIGASATEVTVANYHDPQMAPVTIPLDPRLSPNDNAQAYFRRYRKAKKTLEAAAAQLDESRQEAAYLEGVLGAVEQAETLAELREIEKELTAEGYVKPSARPRRRQAGRAGQEAALPFRRYLTSDGHEVLVGRNNTQNDRLTFKVAQEHDIWLHVQKVPGSHVILRLRRGEDLPQAGLREAAAIAARHSRASQSNQVPVDYTPVKHVRKPPGARPGMVIYDHQRTLYVTPGLPPTEHPGTA